jgi:tetratricopeptide (TPR) repeat protein
MLTVDGLAQTGPDALAHLNTGSAHLQPGQACLALRSPSMIAEAKAELQQAPDLDPDLFWARFYLARVRTDSGRYDKAKQELEQGLEARPNVAHFLALLGEANRYTAAHQSRRMPRIFSHVPRNSVPGLNESERPGAPEQTPDGLVAGVGGTFCCLA